MVGNIILPTIALEVQEMAFWIRDRDDQGTINVSQETNVKTKIKFIS